MPLHDWTRVPAGTYHFFHQRWIISLADALNGGGLPPQYFAMTETATGRPVPDVLAPKTDRRAGGGLAVRAAPPRAAVVSAADERAAYARRADRLIVRTTRGMLIAVVEIVSPGNKDRTAAVGAFVRKAQKSIRNGVHFLFVDPSPPSATNPHGLHKPIWDAFKEEPYTPPADRPLTVAAYSADQQPVAYVEPTAVGLPLADLPLFLTPRRYVPCPLEASYQQAWGVFPRALTGPLAADGPAG
jgi:hypothetical protein